MKPRPGDRVAYTAKFVKNTGGGKHTVDQRGVYVKDDPRTPNMGYVHWDGEDEYLKAMYADDPEYAAHVKENGTWVKLVNICRVGTVRFGDE